MADADADTGPTLGSLSGSPVLFHPMPTPWPAAEGCQNYVYRQSRERWILAWDPAYTSFGGTGAASCLPPQQRQWWNQPNDLAPSIALGPTFACPEAYSAVHSTMVESNSAAQTHFTYCCPPNFELGKLLPPNHRSVGQCTSTAGPGETISYLSVEAVVTSTKTVTGEDGTETLETSTKKTNLPTSTIVKSDSAATVFAPPVNGYNILMAPQATADPSSTETTPLSTTTTPPPPPGASDDVSTQPSAMSGGAIAGAVVGGVLGLALLAFAVYFVRKRYRHTAAVNQPDVETWNGETVAGDYPSPRYGTPYGPVAVSEMSAENRPQELPYGLYAHELPSGK